MSALLLPAICSSPVHPRIILSDAVGNLQAFHGDVLRQLLQAVNEADLPAELLTDERLDDSDECFDVPGRVDHKEPLQILPQPSVNGGVTLSQPFDGGHLIPGSHAAQVHHDIAF